MASSMSRKLGKSLLQLFSVWYIECLLQAFVPGALVNARQLAQTRLAAEPKKRQLPPLTSPANPEEHVFIPLEGYGQKIEDLFEEQEFVFVRGGVAVGKSTMAIHLARQFPETFVCVPFASAAQETWIANINEAVRSATGTAKLQETSPLLCLQTALQLAADNKLILVLDEAHTIFSLPRLCESLFKSARHPKLLLFSASGEGKRSGDVTPSEIKQKFFWTPPVPETDALDDLVTELKEADVQLCTESVAFFLKFCGGHRSIFVAAMMWVKKMQGGTSWAFSQTVAKVRDSIGQGSWATGTILGALAESRGVKVNGDYSDLDVVPKEFIRLLCEGQGNLSDLSMRRELTIQGFVIPVTEGNAEFHQLDWAKPDATYAVANPILASYYRHQLESFRGLKVKVKDEHFVPVNCMDLLIRAMPYLTFAQVVSFAVDLESNSSLSVSDLPYEDQYTGAITHALQRLGYKASAPLNPRNGKVDVLVKIEQTAFSLECIMAKRGEQSHNEHRNRFDNENLTNYFNADHKALLTIGSVETVRERVRNTRADGVEIIGLMPNIAHTGYHVLYRGAAEGTDLVEYYVECDLVARALERNDRIRCIQKMSHINPPRLDQAFGTKVVWVRQLQKDGTVLQDDNDDLKFVGNAFQIDPAPSNIVRGAIKKEEELSIAPSKIDIFSQQDGSWIREEKMSASLRDTDETDCYGFTLPSA
ncbi:unnamed protein product [Durusdinium trenchii]|uniref:AAA+ ATPase domain-containing protein n=1 Tax=Durusdinium trenchii TaxID=1381693 RepID=A0ABP0N3M4_9DINO